MASSSMDIEKITPALEKKVVPGSYKVVESDVTTTSTGVKKKIMKDKGQKAIASTSREVEKRTTEDEVQDDVTTSLLETIQKRTRGPKKLKRVEDRILQRQRREAKNVTVFTTTDIKKVKCGYNLRKPLPKELEEHKEKPDTNTIQARLESIIVKNPDLKKALDEKMKNFVEGTQRK